MELLKILEENRFVSGQLIAEKLSISRAAVHKQIGCLRAKGYKIVGHRNLGYCIVSKPDALTPDEIKALLPAQCVMGRKILCFDRIASTQLKAREAAENAEEGTVIIAEEQSAGFGRLGREWHSGKGGLWFSVILKPVCAPSSVAQIPLLIAIALCRTIENKSAQKALIKWPNDVYVDGKKVSGIITDMAADIDRVHWAVAGIGLNVNNEIPADLQGTAASLSMLCSAKQERAALLAALLIELDAVYTEFTKNGFSGFGGEFTDRSLLIGKAITVHSAGSTLKGTVKGFTAEGALLLATGSRIETILAGDVTIEKPAAEKTPAQPSLFGDTL